MSRYLFLTILIISLAVGACSGRRGHAVHRDTIPEKQFIEILSEIHLADGLLGNPEVSYKYSDRDSLGIYTEIIERFGYTKDMMDRTLKYYFVKKPKQLIKIYDKVLGTLSEMESRVDRELPFFGSPEGNLWKGKTNREFPGPGGTDTAWFEIPITYPGTYYLHYELTIWPDDQTSNPRGGIFYLTGDSTATGEKTAVTTFPYPRNGTRHTFDQRFSVRTSGPGILQGWFIDHSSQSQDREKHYRVDNIVLSRTPYRK